jgi:hypothetical protein
MAPLMLVNPRAEKPRRKRRAATARRRKMTAKQLRYFGPRRARKAATKKAAARKRGAAKKTIVVLSNPKGASMAKRRRRRAHKRHFLKNPRATKRRHFRKNPRIPGASLFNNAIVPAAVGAAGALGVDLLMASVPLPQALRAGAFVPVVKIGVALLIGMAVGSVASREAGEEAAAGGIIVTLYGLARNFMLTRMPGVPLGRYVPMRGVGPRNAQNPRSLRRYIPLNGAPPALLARPGGQGNLGYVNPARIGAGPPTRGTARFLASR